MPTSLFMAGKAIESGGASLCPPTELNLNQRFHNRNTDSLSMKLNYKTNTVMAIAALAVALTSGCATHKCCCSMKPVRLGRASDGAPVLCYTLRNQNGMEPHILNYGGLIQ